MVINKSQIFIGTSQFKSNYGVTNHNKNLSNSFFYKIMEYCCNNGIINFDTASSYNSENLLGNFIKAHKLKKAKISTKIAKIGSRKNYKDFVRNSVENSLNNLNLKIHTLFLHSVNDIDLFIKNYQFFLELKKEYKISKIGFSIYDSKDLKKLIKFKEQLSLQVPVNIPNNNFDHILELKNKPKQIIFGRSLFLQGLLLQKKTKKIKISLKKSLDEYYSYLKKKNLDPLEVNLAYINSKKNLKYYIFGIEKISQIKQIINARDIDLDKNIFNEIRSIFIKNDVDPRNW
jgi:aryl-alcohol dehydrogenase-like predicted oxidoreductase